MKTMHRMMTIVALAAVIVTGSTLDGLCGAKKKSVEGVLNINTATAEQFMLFPGVGKAKADAILATRGEAPFGTVQDLVKVKGIGPKFIENYGSNLSVNGETTLHAGTPAPVVSSNALAAPR